MPPFLSHVICYECGYRRKLYFVKAQVTAEQHTRKRGHVTHVINRDRGIDIQITPSVQTEMP